MAFYATWHIQGNPPKDTIFILRRTAENYEKFLRSVFGSKVEYYTIEELD